MSVDAVNHDAHGASLVASARSPNVADQLQARLFDEILQRELDELERHPGRRAKRLRVAKSDRGNLRLHKDLEPLDDRIDEVRGLLGALRDRFLPM